MLTIALLLNLIAAPASRDSMCDKATTPAAIVECLGVEKVRQDSLLRVLEARVRKDLPAASAARFDSASAAWRAYRDVECRGVFDAYPPGTIASIELLRCSITLTMARRSLLGDLYRSGP